MSSQTSSSSSPVKPAQIIDQLLNTSTSKPHYLQQLVANIEALLHLYTSKRKSSTTHDKLASVRGGLRSASDISKFSEEVSKNVKLISNQISDYTGDKHSTAISVLTAIGNVHWVSVGFLMVATVLERLDKIKNNKSKCLKVLKSMYDLAKIIMQLLPLPHLKIEMQDKMNDSIQLIVNGAILCCVQKKRKTFGRFYNAGADEEDLEELRFQVDAMREIFHLQISANTYDDVHRMLYNPPPPVPCRNTAAVGIDQQITAVMELLEWHNDKPAVAVVVHGIGGAGKTTLADEVYASLNLEGWKHSKITLIKNMELHPNIEELQSQILQDLTGIKHTIRNCQIGWQELARIIEREDVFIYMDNILKREHLENLLPRHIASSKKVRILATARKTNVLGVFESCGIKPCKLYSIESLSFEAAMEVLCTKIDREKEIKSIVNERPQANMIAQKFCCCPLFLEVVGAYLHKRNNEVIAYERVFGWLKDGEPFSCDKEDSFDESRIMFAYHQLESSAQEAFLDICSFFYDWEWKDVALIVGVEELQCLQDGALVKKIEVEEGFEVKRKVERINIHDLLLTAGRNKSKDNRFRSVDDFSRALTNEEILHQTKGVWLKSNYVTITPFHISADVIDAMSGSLRVFSMGKHTIVNGQCRKHFDKLRFLEGDKVPNLGIDISKLKHLVFLVYSFRKDEIWSPPKNISSLHVLKLHKYHAWPPRRNMDAAIEFGHFNKLKHLTLSGFHINEISSLVKLNGLEKLKLSSIQGPMDLPGLFWKLRSLQELYLSCCHEFKQLPAGFGESSALSRFDLEDCNFEELPCDFNKLLALKSLNLAYCSSLLALPEGLGNLPLLTYIDLLGCRQLSSLPSGVVERSLLKGRISFDGCSGLEELPEDICKVTILTSLSLEDCKSLKVLPIGFSELTCLQELVLKQCESLQELCNNFHCLVGLRILNMSGCKALSRLPQGFGKLVCLERLELAKCDRLEELSSDFGCLGALKYLVLSRCKNLSKLPDCFGKLGCLETLELSGCDKLEELSSDFGCLKALKYLVLSRCKSLSKLPDCFGKLGCLETLELSECDKLEELCSDFGLLGALRNLTLSRCKNLSKISDCFGQLGFLEMLDLSMCSKLEELSRDFHCLPSLVRLDLSHCESLGGQWMDSVGVIQSLWRLDITGTERMIKRWIELQRLKKGWHFVVVIDSSWEA